MTDHEPIPDADFAAAERFLAEFVPVCEFRPPAGFADRVVRVELRRRTRVKAVRACFASGLAAAIAVAVFLPGRPAGTPAARPEVAAATPPVRIDEKAAEAKSAVVALTVKTTEETFAPAVSLFAAGPAPVKVQTSAPLTEMPSAAKAGFDPLANTARRAVNLFKRDVVAAARF